MLDVQDRVRSSTNQSTAPINEWRGRTAEEDVLEIWGMGIWCQRSHKIQGTEYSQWYYGPTELTAMVHGSREMTTSHLAMAAEKMSSGNIAHWYSGHTKVLILDRVPVIWWFLWFSYHFKWILRYNLQTGHKHIFPNSFQFISIQFLISYSINAFIKYQFHGQQQIQEDCVRYRLT
jgi:hypothetical protein